MYSVEGEFEQRELKVAIAAFTHRQPSPLLSHAADCCLIAKEWFLAMDRGLRVGDSEREPPRWLREYFEWGPSRWPLYWCEATQRDVLDCGGLAALARESFIARGIPALPTQLIRLHSKEDSSQWEAVWSKEGLRADWIHEPYIYHEAVAVVRRETLHVWDPSGSFWIDPELRLGYTCTVAIRVISTSSEVPNSFLWGRYHLFANSWKSVLD